MSYINVEWSEYTSDEKSDLLKHLIYSVGNFCLNHYRDIRVKRDDVIKYEKRVNKFIERYLKTDLRVKIPLLDKPDDDIEWRDVIKKRKIVLNLYTSLDEKKKELNKILEQTYELLKGHDFYIVSIEEIDNLYEQLVTLSGHFDPIKREFKNGKEWTELDHKIHDICWNWYMRIIEKKLKITKYYKKYYNKYLVDE